MQLPKIRVGCLPKCSVLQQSKQCPSYPVIYLFVYTKIKSKNPDPEKENGGKKKKKQCLLLGLCGSDFNRYRPAVRQARSTQQPSEDTHTHIKNYPGAVVPSSQFSITKTQNHGLYPISCTPSVIDPTSPVRFSPEDSRSVPVSGFLKTPPMIMQASHFVSSRHNQNLSKIPARPLLRGHSNLIVRLLLMLRHQF